MNILETFAVRRPLLFSVIATLVVPILGVLVVIVVDTAVSGHSRGMAAYQTPSRLLSIALTLGLLWRLGWLRPAGLSGLGSWSAWCLAPGLLLYGVLSNMYAAVGHVRIVLGQSPPGCQARIGGGLLFLLPKGDQTEGSGYDRQRPAGPS